MGKSRSNFQKDLAKIAGADKESFSVANRKAIKGEKVHANLRKKKAASGRKKAVGGRGYVR